MRMRMIWMGLLSAMATASLALSIYNFCASRSVDEKEYYTMFVGTNDKDTYNTEIPFDEAFRKIEAICVNYLDGATFETVKGIWKDEKGNVTHENTIQIYIYHSDIDTIHKLSDEILKELNQESIMIINGRASIQYYSGK